MKGLGILLVLSGGVAVIFINWIVGVALIVIGLLMMIAGGTSDKPVARAICPHCGNPVVRTANICPTCQGALIPREGPLAPPALDKKGNVITVETPAAARRSTAIALGAALLIIAVLVVMAVIAANNLH